MTSLVQDHRRPPVWRALTSSRLMAHVCAGALVVGASQASAAVWQGSWGAAPAGAMTSALDLPPSWASPKLNGQTIVEQVRLSGGGRRLRLRLSNEFGDRPLLVGHVGIELLDSAGAPLPGSARELAFSGAPDTIIPLHAAILSDPIPLAAPPLAHVRVSLYLPGDAQPCTCHSDGRQSASISPPGDFVGRPFTPAATTSSRAFLTGIDVEAESAGPVVVTLGDSITDGYMSIAGSDHRWPDRLAERLAGQHADVVNAGIGGNRLLQDDALPAYGQNALARFDRDVLGVAGVTHLIVLEGINDLGGSPTPRPEALIGAYRQIIARAHSHGIKVILGTLPPYEGAPYFRPEGEAARQVVNQWIRRQAEADGVIDFDAVLRDPARPSRLRAELQSGDWLHPNDEGYRAMGDAADLTVFR